MKKFIPYEKLSKKKKRERDLKQRLTWGENGFNPNTRVKESGKIYSRSEIRENLRKNISEI